MQTVHPRQSLMSQSDSGSDKANAKMAHQDDSSEVSEEELYDYMPQLFA
jgi:hypothetical protein